jgi:hypothetical protein
MISKRYWRLRERRLSGILDNEEKFAQQRVHMVEEQIVRRGIRDERVIAAFREYPAIALCLNVKSLERTKIARYQSVKIKRFRNRTLWRTCCKR